MRDARMWLSVCLDLDARWQKLTSNGTVKIEMATPKTWLKRGVAVSQSHTSLVTLHQDESGSGFTWKRDVDKLLGEVRHLIQF